MSWSFDIITTTANRVKLICKTMFEIVLARWLKPSLDLVSNLTPLRFWQLKTLLPEGCVNFERLFLKIFKLSELGIFRSNLFHLMTTEGKKEFRKKLCLTLNWEILLVFLVLFVLTVTGLTLNIVFLENYGYKLYRSGIVSCTIFFFQGFPNLVHYKVSL